MAGFFYTIGVLSMMFSLIFLLVLQPVPAGGAFMAGAFLYLGAVLIDRLDKIVQLLTLQAVQAEPRDREPATSNPVTSSPPAPRAATTIQAACLSCGTQLKFSVEHAGKNARCPSCRSIIMVPGRDAFSKDTNCVTW